MSDAIPGETSADKREDLDGPPKSGSAKPPFGRWLALINNGEDSHFGSE